MKSLQEVLKEGNSTTNQRIKQRFIDQHVNANVNSLVEFVISKSYEGDDKAPFSYDDIENMFSLPEYYGKYVNFNGGTEDERAEETERLEAMLYSEGNNEETDYKIQEEINELNDLESEPQEVLEWWIVSSFLAEKLNELGHPTLTDENIWGRCTSGQAILLDYSITQICANMEILKGQKSSWAK